LLAYWCLYFFIVALSGVSILFRHRLNNLLFILALIILVIFATVRGVGVGSDDVAYMNMLESIGKSTGNVFDIGYQYGDYNIEILFFYFLVVLSSLGTSSYLLLGSVSLISLVLNLYVFKRWSPIFIGTVAVFFTHLFLAEQMNALRLALASSILLLSMLFLYEKRYVLVGVLVAIASSIHVSALVFFLPLGLVMLKINRSIALVLLVLVIAIGASGVLDVNSIIRLVESDGFIYNKLLLYSKADGYNFSIPLLNLVNIKNFLLLFISLFYWNSLKEKYVGFYITFVFFLSAAALRVAFGGFAIVGGRLYAALSVVECVLVAMVVCCLFGKSKGLVIMLLYAAILLSYNLYLSPVPAVGGYFI